MKCSSRLACDSSLSRSWSNLIFSYNSKWEQQQPGSPVTRKTVETANTYFLKPFVISKLMKCKWRLGWWKCVMRGKLTANDNNAACWRESMIVMKSSEKIILRQHGAFLELYLRQLNDWGTCQRSIASRSVAHLLQLCLKPQLFLFKC